MDGVQLYSESQDAISTIISVGVPALVALVFLVLGLLGGGELAARIRAFAPKTRKYIDEPTDPLIKVTELVGELLTHKDVNPDQLIKLFTAVVDELSKKPDDKPIEAVK